MSKGLQIATGAAVIAVLLGWYAYDALGPGGDFQVFTYYRTLEEFQQTQRPGKAARVHGYVAPGSIERDVAGRQVRFHLQSRPPHAAAAQQKAPGAGERTLPVTYAGLDTPDLFGEGAEVVVEGRSRANDARFYADNVLAKCPSKFEAAEQGAVRPGEAGEASGPGGAVMQNAERLRRGAAPGAEL